MLLPLLPTTTPVRVVLTKGARVPLGLTCKVDSHSHDDDDDPHDDGDAEHIGPRRPSLQAPSGPPVCTLLRDCREGGRNPVLQQQLAGAPLPEPPNTSRSRCSPHLSSSLGERQRPHQEKWPGLKWPDLLWGSLTNLAHCWPRTAGSITEQCRALSQGS